VQAKSTFVSGSSEAELLGAGESNGPGDADGSGEAEELTTALEAEVRPEGWLVALAHAATTRMRPAAHFLVIES
jgi:hypothetical protein